jgi:hypothetical protein
MTPRGLKQQAVDIRDDGVCRPPTSTDKVTARPSTFQDDGDWGCGGVGEVGWHRNTENQTRRRSKNPNRSCQCPLQLHLTKQQQTHVHAKHQCKQNPSRKHTHTEINAYTNPNTNIKINSTHTLHHDTTWPQATSRRQPRRWCVSVRHVTDEAYPLGQARSTMTVIVGVVVMVRCRRCQITETRRRSKNPNCPCQSPLHHSGQIKSRTHER